jgi:hypothetical protein
VSKSPVVEGIFYNFTLKLYYYFGFIGKKSDLPVDAHFGRIA